MINIQRIATNLMLMAGAIGLFFALDVNDEDWGGNVFPPLKFLPYELSLMALLLWIVSSTVRITPVFISLTVFSLIWLGGSSYSLMVSDIELSETYFGRGLGCIVMMSAYYLAQHKDELQHFFKMYVPMIFGYLIFATLIAIGYRLGFVYGEYEQIYQVESIINAVAIVAAAGYFKSKLYKNIAIALGAICLLLIAKTTAIALLACSLGFTFNSYVSDKLGKQSWSQSDKKLVHLGIFSILTVILIVAFGFLYQDRLDDRGNDIREANAEIRLLQFEQSPLIGELFTGSPLVDFGPLHIPSHSEWLDMLASAGTLAIFLFLLPISMLLMKSSLLKASKDGLLLRQWLGFVLVAYVVLMIVNPILFLPGLSFLFWASLGLLAGLVAGNADYFMIEMKSDMPLNQAEIL